MAKGQKCKRASAAVPTQLCRKAHKNQKERGRRGGEGGEEERRRGGKEARRRGDEAERRGNFRNYIFLKSTCINSFVRCDSGIFSPATVFSPLLSQLGIY